MNEIVSPVRIIAAVSALFAVQCFAQPQAVPANGLSAVADSDYAITQVGPHSRVWQTSSGQSVTEIATGMNYLANGQWLTSDNSFALSQDGTSFVADKIQDPTRISAQNIAVQGAAQVVTPQGVTLSSTPMAISLYDAASGLSVIIASITNTAGVMVDPQHIVFSHAFLGGGFDASVVYSLPDTGSFHQDVIFTGFDPNFDPTVWGFAAASTNTLQIQVLTEFYNAPSRRRRSGTFSIEQNPNVRASMVSPDTIDYTLDWGDYVMGPGRVHDLSQCGRRRRSRGKGLRDNFRETISRGDNSASQHSRPVAVPSANESQDRLPQTAQCPETDDRRRLGAFAAER